MIWQSAHVKPFDKQIFKAFVNCSSNIFAQIEDFIIVAFHVYA